MRLSACTRGGGSSCAARDKASPPPTTGSVSAKPSTRASAASTAAHPVNAGIGGGAISGDSDTRRARDRDRAPDDREHDDPDADPDAARHRIAADVAADARREPEQPDRDDRDRHREILGPDVAGETKPGDRRRRYAGQVVADHDAGERAEEHALDQRRRLRTPAARAPKALRHAADEAAGDEQRPALDVDRARERRQHRRGEDEPRRRLPERVAGDAGNEERRHPELRDRERGGLAH